ncbi:Nif3-like dinuclear metal center hexameric protein [Vitreoscilla sp. C1]|uniref:Nif3-like dinuclear metal center hexameric protein n=1 Tax=Vitreoscilla sp. (strain C1) TaxID=96942 RepID=UPI000CDC8E09|nr:Nif3-like dinuclear metal center hexameric protein [Vitreoscilla sp. C1]AUZ03898.1 Nif3-like dinuclear metal center hexameric protein [Vitreoscilla sp. C1]
MQRNELMTWIHNQLQVDVFKDYAPNGLQLQGKAEIGHITCAVTASLAAIEAAVANGSDLLLVHHGWFWKSEPTVITDWKFKRIQTAMQAGLNIAGYHLPLDAHPQWGNNAQLAHVLGLKMQAQFGHQNLLAQGVLQDALSLADFNQQIETALQRQPTVIGRPEKPIQHVAWCTGGAQGFFQDAIDAGVDAYITGEISEAQYHLANETDVAFIAAGHHATERYGIQALASAIEVEFGIAHQFFDEANPA